MRQHARRLPRGFAHPSGVAVTAGDPEPAPAGPAARFAPVLRYAARLAAFTAVYVVAAKLGLSLAGMHDNVSLVWPATGIALATLVRAGYRFWPAVALGAFLANASTDVPVATAAGIATGNTLEALSGAYLLQRLVGFGAPLDRLRDVLGLVGVAAGLSPAVGATAGVASLCLGDTAPWTAFGPLWWHWWLGDAMGALVVAPALLTWGPRLAPPEPWPPLGEVGALLVALATVSGIVFGGSFTTDTPAYPLGFAILPVVVWAALRFGPRGAAGATLVVSGIAVWGTAKYAGPFAGETLTESLLLLQTFMAVVAVMGLVLGALTVQRRRAEMALQQSERRYRDLVENASDLLYTLDLAGRFTSLNRAGERLTGYARADVLGRSFVDTVVARPYRELARVMLARQTTDDAPVVYGLEIVARDGRRVPVEIGTRRVFHDGSPVGVQGIARDVTERKQAEAALEAANWKLTGWVSELEERTRQITLLSEMGELLQSCVSAEEAYTIVGHAAEKLFPGASGMLAVFSVSKSVVEPVATWGPAPPADRLFAAEQCWALRRGRAHLYDAPAATLSCRHAEAAGATRNLCVPMMAQGEPLGVLHLRHEPGGTRRPAATPVDLSAEPQQRLAVTVAEHIALALANLRLQETLRSQAIRDPLTGLFNRRYMEESLEREVRRSARSGGPLGIIMLDIDHFKAFNDAHGHPAGDALLAALGTFLRAHVRAEDIACRYGGEEFTLILPDASLEATRERAQEVRDRVTKLEIPYRGGSLPSITVSLGVAGFPQHGAVGQDVLMAADAALYRAKHDGRDRVVVAE
ncbi:MAG: diguanylate cyclase [Candidatus Rokuibacteriota bacterium]